MPELYIPRPLSHHHDSRSPHLHARDRRPEGIQTKYHDRHDNGARSPTMCRVNGRLARQAVWSQAIGLSDWSTSGSTPRNEPGLDTLPICNLAFLDDGPSTSLCQPQGITALLEDVLRVAIGNSRYGWQPGVCSCRPRCPQKPHRPPQFAIRSRLGH